MNRRVVVTGMGAVTPIGNSIPEFYDSLENGKNGIGPITRFDTSEFKCRIAGEVKEFSPEDRIEKKDIRRMDLFTQYALYAADMAIEDAGLKDNDDINKERVGVIVGSGIGGILTFEKQTAVLNEKGVRKVSPFFITMLIADISPGRISIAHGFKGPNYAVTSACATANHAIGDSFRQIQYGSADVMIAGGSEATVATLAVAGFMNMQALSRRNDEPEKASRPFDLERNGFILSEGGGILVLEELEHAKARGARIYAEIGGLGNTGDAYHITAPAPGGEGAVRAINIALEDAGIKPEEVDYINAHGTSTQFNDKNETAAIKTVFGKHAYKLSVSSTKSMTGHLLGAAGAVEAIACIFAINKSLIPPTINYEFPDPECDLDYTPNKAAAKEVNIAISNTFGFGGHNSVILFKKYDS
ncbi:beta-ketoacyl-[acyl-carrier-protein] synthase II [Candidatus Marinimicrobia bacterium MT.SAG.4]|nr:beta-ketoacyl-[acyl-carrier-protein] synthase II [Candidatus Marinimicrobia bacterium MT.SAG.4]